MRFPTAMLLTVLAWLSLLATTIAQQAANKGSTPNDLVAQLGSRKFAERNAAAATLEILGAAALPALKEGLKSSSLEVRRRIVLVQDKIHQQMEAARLLAPKRLRLVYKNRPVLEALDELAAQTGFPLQFTGNRAALADRTLTLDTGETTYWEAFALFCAKAGLVEQPLPALHRMDDPGEEKKAAFPTQDLMLLANGQAKPVPTCFAGKLRVRALAATYPHQKGETAFLLSVTPEPNMGWRVLERLTILQAIDNHGQPLFQPAPYVLAAPQPLDDSREAGRWDAGSGSMLGSQTVDLRTLLVRLTVGKQPSTHLREVRGRLTLGLTALRPVVAVEQVSKAVGKPVLAANGGTLEIVQYKQEGKVLHLQVRLQGFPLTGQNGQAIQVVRRKPGFVSVTASLNVPPHLTLLDTQGNPIPAVRVSSEVTPRPEGGLTREVTLLYPLQPNQAAARLVFSAPAPVQVEVPFTLRDVPLVPLK